MNASDHLPRLALIGPMLGRHPGWVTNPGERLAERFREEGYTVRLSSTIPNRILRLADILRSMIAWRRQVDLFVVAVYSGRAFWLADLPAWLAGRLGVPLVYVLHGGDLPRLSREQPDWVRRVMDRAVAIVSPSAFLAHHFQQWGGYEVRVIPNLLEIEQYRHRLRPTVRPRLLWMRTFEDIYNPEMAVQAIKCLVSVYPDACLTMAGQDRGQLAAVQALVRSAGLDEVVRFAGFLDEDAKQYEFDAHDIYLHTNRVDNAPVSVIEAAAYGLPVVATRVGGLPFLLDEGRTGLLVSDGDAQAMAAAVSRLVEEPGLAGRLSVNGRALAEACAWPSVKRLWEGLFDEMNLFRRLG